MDRVTITDVLTTINFKTGVLWDVTLYSLEKPDASMFRVEYGTNMSLLNASNHLVNYKASYTRTTQSLRVKRNFAT
jgi:hypothetical protein